jgi:nitrogen fixation protein
MLLASSIKPGRTPVLVMDALDETGCGRLTAFVAQKDSGLPVVKVGEADPVGELQNGDELRHAWELRLARRAIGFKTVLRIVGLEVAFRVFE